ncbi:hypothetical protein OURE66S_02634 [Oligella ureolytica]
MKKYVVIAFFAGMYVMWLLMSGLDATAMDSGLLRIAGLAGYFLGGFFIVAVVFFFFRTIWRLLNRL